MLSDYDIKYLNSNLVQNVIYLSVTLKKPSQCFRGIEKNVSLAKR